MNQLGNWLIAQSVPLESVQKIAREFGREDWWLWTLITVGLLSLCGWWYRRDTQELSFSWRVFLFGLRAAVWIGLLLIFLDPQERIETEVVRPSRVALLLDTSASMGFPAESKETGTTTPSSRSERLLSLLESGPLLPELRKTHEIEVSTFDTQLVARGTLAQIKPGTQAKPGTDASVDVPPPAWKDWLAPRGDETRLGESLAKLIRETAGETLSGIILFSDGANNSGVETSVAHDAAIASGTRLITVGIGGLDKPVNLQIQTVQAPTHAHVGDGFQITAFLSSQGLVGQQVTVELLGKEERATAPPTVLQSRSATILEDGVPVSLTFQYESAVPGRKIFSIRASAGPGVQEFTLADNEKPLPPIEMTDKKTKVLLLAGGPMRDYQFVRNLYYRDPGIELHLWLQSGDPQISQEAAKLLTSFPTTREELFEYDVIVAFDPNWKAIPPGALETFSEWIFQQAGGLILLAGDVNTPNLVAARNDLMQVKSWYPVNLPSFYDPELLSENSKQPWPIQLTREGASSEFLNMNDGPAGEESIWKSFSGVYRCFPDEGPKPGATVLAVHSDPRSKSEKGFPTLIASQFFGAGRILYLGSPEFWRLRAIDESYYDRFWIKALREVGQGRLLRGSTRGLLLLEKSTYPLGSSVDVRVRVLDQKYQPLITERITAELIDPRGQITLSGLELRGAAQRPGEYQGSFVASIPGRYRIKFMIPQSTEDVVGYVQAELPDYEYLHPEQDRRGLERLATTENGGACLTTDEAIARLVDLLPDKTTVKTEFDVPRPLWDRGWVMGVLVGLLSLEWLTRKLLKLA